MIIISNIEELEQYKVETKFVNDKRRFIKNLTTYEFKENGKFADVVFNVDVIFNPGTDFSKVNLNEWFETYDVEKDEGDDFVKLVAKSIHAKQYLKVGIIVANKLFFDETCTIQQSIAIKETLQGKKLECEGCWIICENIICDVVYAEQIKCLHLEAKRLWLDTLYFENIKAENVNFYREEAIYIKNYSGWKMLDN